MKCRVIRSAFAAAALLAFSNLAPAADAKPGVQGEAKVTDSAKAATAKSGRYSSDPRIKLVDINSANKAELKTLPGISDADADKIIAGRPYGSKAHLTTRGIIPAATYDNLKKRVIAKQKPEAAAKPAKK